MKNKKIVLIVDNPKRDLDGLLAIAYELVSSGHQVYLTPMYFQNCDIPFIEPSYVLLNYIRNTNAQLASSYERAGIRVGVLDTEGGVLSSDGMDAPDNLAKAFLEKSFDQSIHQYFFWGSSVAKPFYDHQVFTQQNGPVTGCPRYDFCHNPLRKTLSYQHSNFILINTNFSTVNAKFGKEKIDRDAFISTGWSKDYTELLIKETLAAFERYKAEIKKLFTDLPHIQFVIRPHPFEDHEVYTSSYAEFDNVLVDPSGNVLNALAAASGMLHLNCGSALESIILETPTICMDHLNTEVLYKQAHLAKDVSYNTSSYEDLKESVEKCISGTFNFPFKDKKDELIVPWLSNASDPASTAVAEHIQNEVTQKSGPQLIGLKERSLGLLKRTDPLGLANQLFNLSFGSKSLERVRCAMKPNRKDKSLNINYINNQLQAIQLAKESRVGIKAQYATRPLGQKLTSVVLEKRQ